MTSAVDHVRPGQPWEPAKARLRNAWTDAAYALSPSQRGVSQREKPNPQDLRILVYASTEIAAGEASGWGTIAIPTTQSRKQEVPIFPAADPSRGAWGIAPKGIAAGETGELIIKGMAWASVDFSDVGHEWVDAATGGGLESGICGYAKVMQAPTATGTETVPIMLSYQFDPGHIAQLNVNIAENASGLVTLCRGPVTAITCAGSEEIDVEGSAGTLWAWSDSTDDGWIWSDSTLEPGDEVLAWNFGGRRGYAGERVTVIPTMLQGDYPCFYTIRFHAYKTITGTADQSIDPGDDANDNKTITVVYGDEAVSSQHVVEYILHQAGGTISQGKVVTADYYPSRGQYVIRLGDCEA